MQFDMNRTWSQAVALVKANFQLLAVIAGVFLLLPFLAMYLAFPELLLFSDPMNEPQLSQDEFWRFFSKFSLVIIGMIVVQLVGQMAMMALIGGKRPTVGEAIALSVRALPTALGASLLLGLIFLLCVIALAIVLVLLTMLVMLVAGEGGAAIVSALVYIALLGAGLYAYARLCVMLPVIVLGGTRGPLTVLKRSWRLTKGNGRPIFLFFSLLLVAYFVISLVLGIGMSAFGILTGAAPSTGAIVTLSITYGLMGMIVAMVTSGIIVSIYQQLAGMAEPPEVEFDA